MNDPLAYHLAWLAPVGLDELNANAGLQVRVDRKYALTVPEAARLLAGLDAGTRVLEIDRIRTFGYRSVYLDTPELTSFQLAAHRRRRRFKVRIRTYLDSSLTWLEVKTRGPRGATVKDRLRYDSADGIAGRRFVDAVLAHRTVPVDRSATLVPTLTTGYRRSTLLLPDARSRVTIDTGLSWSDHEGRRLSLPGLVIVETKTGSSASSVDRLLWDRGHRPVRISKYATGLAALHPELPATPWRRTLRRYFPPPAARTGSGGRTAGWC